MQSLPKQGRHLAMSPNKEFKRWLLISGRPVYMILELNTPLTKYLDVSPRRFADHWLCSPSIALVSHHRWVGSNNEGAAGSRT